MGNSLQQSQVAILIHGTRDDPGNDGQRIITSVNLVKQMHETNSCFNISLSADIV